MALHDLTDFLRLSAALNMQLTAQGVGRENIVRLITNRVPLERDSERKALLHVLEYLDHAYGAQRRRVGPPAILHPLRATALLSQAAGRPHLLDMLTELLHDKYEDLTVEALGPERFGEAEAKFRNLLKDIDPTDEWYLMERLDHLAIRAGESYYEYIGRLLDRTVQTPELVRVKLADRLDNTLDMHINVDDLLKDTDFFRVIFQVLFPPSGSGYRTGIEHPVNSPLDGAQRLYQLFKNAILLSLIREKGLVRGDRTSARLFDALALAGMNEAQRIALHIMAYHETDVERQRSILMEVQGYAQAGGLAQITSPGGKHLLDGFCMNQFNYPDSSVRNQRLEELYRDKELMLQAALGFVVIFMNFAHSPDYWLRGISDQGITAAGN
ncbi:MAG: hypothetical protein QM330_08140 [Acidobacteriota bacterium]|jgi:hypothetical protein|nr:hypothetical protein [Acidobacteriota bacterium]NLT33548.1 hypothetical protein [Acidobacteriota bacterium]